MFFVITVLFCVPFCSNKLSYTCIAIKHSNTFYVFYHANVKINIQSYKKKRLFFKNKSVFFFFSTFLFKNSFPE